MTNIMVCTPCYGSMVYEPMIQSLIATMREGQERGVRIEWQTTVDSLVTRARDNLVRDFLDNDKMDYLLFIDADIAFNPSQVWRLLDRNVNVAVAAYPFKKLFPYEGIEVNEEFTWEDIEALHHRFVLNPLPNESIDEYGFIKVYDGATGFMLISRNCLETMKESYPELNYFNDMTGVYSENDFLFFSEMIEETEDGKLRRLSEDYAFCRRWQDIGGYIYLDAHSVLTHIGNHFFRGNLQATMKVRTYVRERNRLLQSTDL